MYVSGLVVGEGAFCPLLNARWCLESCKTQLAHRLVCRSYQALEHAMLLFLSLFQKTKFIVEVQYLTKLNEP